MTSLAITQAAVVPQQGLYFVSQGTALHARNAGVKRRHGFFEAAPLQSKRRSRRRNLRPVIVALVALLVLFAIGYYMSILGFGDLLREDHFPKMFWKRGAMNRMEVFISNQA